MSEIYWVERQQKKENVGEQGEYNEKKERSYISSATGRTVTASASDSARKIAEDFKKPDKYDRTLYDSEAAKRKAKADAFRNGNPKDPYSHAELERTIADAKSKYGEDWAKHLAEADHIVPLEKVYDMYKNSPFVSNSNMKDMANNPDNLQVVNREFNNAKRSRTNEELVNDKDYLKRTGIELPEEGAKKAVQSGKEAQKALKKQGRKTAVKNVAGVWHDAGKTAGKEGGITALTMSGIMNIVSVIKGEKNPKDALADTAGDAAKGAVTGYAMGGGLTVMAQGLSSSSSKFIQALTEANIPGKVITTVMTIGDVLMRYGRGEISTQECILQLGERGFSSITAVYTASVGQALIPIPIVGAAVGALVGSVLASGLYQRLIDSIQRKELEKQERQRIIEESTLVAEQARTFRKELELYLARYFRKYQDCFDEALSEMQSAFLKGDADGVITGANQITRKLGGSVRYETVAEFNNFLMDDSVDIL